MLVLSLLLLVAVSSLMVGLGIFLESRRTQSLEQRTFAVATILISLWTAINATLLLPDHYGNQNNLTFFNVINSMGFAFGCLLLLLIYVFGLFYPTRKKLKLFQKSVICLGLVLTAIAPLKFVAGSFVLQNNHLVYQSAALGALVAVMALFVVFGIYKDNARLLRAADNPQLRRQAITLLAGLTLTIIHATVFIIVLPKYFDNKVTVYAVGYFAPYYYLVFTIYGLVRQRLFDIRLIIARAVAYLFMLASFTAIFLGGAFVISSTLLSSAHPTMLEQLVYLLITIALVLVYQPLRRFFDKITNRFFYRDAYDTQTFFDRFNNVLVATYELSPLLRKSASIIGDNLKPTFTVFELKETGNAPQRIMGSAGHPAFTSQDINYMRSVTPKMKRKLIITDLLEDKYGDLQKVLRANNIAVLARLASNTNEEGIGFLVLGPKKSGNMYSGQDLKNIEIVANELVIAIQNALRFEEIENFNLTLQGKVDDATRKLRKANERLKELDETKDDFISMASHQLRTPLTSVKGYISMVLEGDAGKLNDSQRKLLEQSFFSSQRMVFLIADLLNVSRLKTGKFIIEPAPVNLADMVEQEMDQLRETAAGKELTLSYDKPEHFPTLMLDETKTRQVIMNFADNAIYYTPQGGHIRVELAETPASVELRIVDDGIGVPKAEQHHLFTKFYRAGNARKARPDGTGLGLFMAKKVVVAQGGAIIFESEEGKGSTFGFVFSKTKLAPSGKPTPKAKEATKA